VWGDNPVVVRPEQGVSLSLATRALPEEGQVAQPNPTRLRDHSSCQRRCYSRALPAATKTTAELAPRVWHHEGSTPLPLR
jgi:hypothetical protein